MSDCFYFSFSLNGRWRCLYQIVCVYRMKYLGGGFKYCFELFTKNQHLKACWPCHPTWGRFQWLPKLDETTPTSCISIDQTKNPRIFFCVSVTKIQGAKHFFRRVAAKYSNL